MTFSKPSSETGSVGFYQFKGLMPSYAQNYIDNQFPNCLDKSSAGDSISGHIQLLSGAELEADSGSSIVVDSGATLTLIDGLTLNTPTSLAGFIKGYLTFTSTQTSPTISQATNVSDVACKNLTIASQAPYASSTGGHENPGTLFLSIPAPASGGTQGIIGFQDSGSQWLSFGAVNGTSANNAGIKFDGNNALAPSIWQNAPSTDVSTNAMFIRAQNANSGASVNTSGAALNLQSGAGVSQSGSGNLNLIVGSLSNVALQCNPTSVSVYPGTSNQTPLQINNWTGSIGNQAQIINTIAATYHSTGTSTQTAYSFSAFPINSLVSMWVSWAVRDNTVANSTVGTFQVLLTTDGSSNISITGGQAIGSVLGAGNAINTATSGTSFILQAVPIASTARNWSFDIRTMII